ncbi:MAG: GNAT family N-acetyltransferase [Chlamydiae bacterium]|nr:GNAT family N-acetyltransferase [Chlamydiota bacterium]
MITARNIKLRPLRERDLVEFFQLLDLAYLSSDFFMKELGSEYKFKKKFMETGLWEDDEGYILILDLKDRIIGTVSYKKAGFLDAYELTYLIFKTEDRGKGYMKEALSLFSAYLFSSKKINRLQLSIPDYHRASIAVAQKCGYVFEGIAREAAFSKGKYLDLCIYSMLRKECKNIDRLY